jgi:AraC-like DNA-binding protein
MAHQEDLLFTRSRTYSLICSFFDKVMQMQETTNTQGAIHYDQVIAAQNLILKNLKSLPTIEAIARKVNMSPSSLLRQFKLMYGKSLYEYALEKKMELAKKLVVEEQLSVKTIANRIGYKHASTFIEAFTKWHGCRPGNLKLYQQ